MTDRREFQCHHPHCDSQAEFVVHVHIETREGQNDAVRLLSFESTIKTCARHQSLPYFFSDQNRQAIHDQCLANGYGHPVFGTARLEFKPIERGRNVLELHTVPDIVLGVDHGYEIARCDREGCANPAKYQVVQQFKCIGALPKSKPIVQLLTVICVCEKHRKLTRPGDFQDEDFRKRTKKRLNDAGILLPDLDNFRLEFVPLVDGQRIDPATFASVPEEIGGSK